MNKDNNSGKNRKRNAKPRQSASAGQREIVHGDVGIRAHAVLPDNVADEELVHYANLIQQRDGTFACFCGKKGVIQRLTETEAAELMEQKMSDGYEWRWRYSFVTATPRHFSFTVTFGRDRRVKGITDTWGWD